MNDLTREQKMAAARVRMAELAAKFLARTDTDIATMREDLARLATGEAAALENLRHLAHRMVGTGATLGFESLSEVAARIEKLVETPAPGMLPDEGARARLGEELESLAAEFEKHRGS